METVELVGVDDDQVMQAMDQVAGVADAPVDDDVFDQVKGDDDQMDVDEPDAAPLDITFGSIIVPLYGNICDDAGNVIGVIEPKQGHYLDSIAESPAM